MRAILFAVLSVAASIAIAIPCAQAQTSLPEITVSPLPPKGIDFSTTNPKAGNGDGKKDDHAFDHLNQQLKRKVNETNPTDNAPPIDARSSDLKTGVVNIPGVQQQYGKNFGRSVVPYRPAPPVYTSPLGRH